MKVKALHSADQGISNIYVSILTIFPKYITHAAHLAAFLTIHDKILLSVATEV